MSHWIGVHPSEEGGIDLAVERAHRAGAQSIQLFTAIPKFYNEKASIRPERVERFHTALAQTGIPAERVMVHAGYPIHPATDDPARWTRAAAGLARELERTDALGVLGLCFHPGSASDDPMHATTRVGKAITQALEQVEGKTRIFVENTAGAGRTMGRTPEEIGAMLAAVPPQHHARIGYGLDTCHLYAAGYDIAASPEALTGILDMFEAVIGRPPSFFHLNDSDGELGSNRDRHRLIGEGQIGVEPFRWLLHDRRTAGVPLILETPAAREPAADDPAPDPNDLAMVKLLRELASPAHGQSVSGAGGAE